VVICLQRGADLHMAQWIPLQLTVSCFSKIQIGFTFLVLADPGSPGQRAVKRVCVCVHSLCKLQMLFNLWWNSDKPVLVGYLSISVNASSYGLMKHDVGDSFDFQHTAYQRVVRTAQFNCSSANC